MNNLDSSIDDMQNTRFNNMYHNLINQLSRQQTLFNHTDISSILMVYHKFVMANGPKARMMTKKQFHHLFLVLFKIYDLSIIDRILINLTHDVKYVDPSAWVKLFMVFMTNNLETRMKFAFQVYNVHGTGYLNRELVTMAVEKFFTGEDEDEVNELRSDMVEFIFNKFDVDRDGLISYDDYATVVAKQPCLMEFLGQCFPSQTESTIIAYCSNIISKLEF